MHMGVNLDVSYTIYRTMKLPTKAFTKMDVKRMEFKNMDYCNMKGMVCTS